MNNKFTMSVSIQELAVICRALRFMRESAKVNGDYYNPDTKMIEPEYQILNKILNDIDPAWRLM